MTNPAPFISALLAIFNSGFTALGFTEAQIFRLANCRTLPQHRVPYSAYRNFVEDQGAADFRPYTDPVLDALQQIYVVIEGNTLGQQQMLIQEITEDKPNWRRLTWLVSKRLNDERTDQRKADKKERAERALAKIAEQAQKAALKAAEAEAKIKDPKPTDTPAETAEHAPAPAEAVQAAPAPKPQPAIEMMPLAKPAGEVATAPQMPRLTKAELKAKWKNRFRPDWHWNVPGQQSVFVSVKQLRAIEAEIAAEREAGAPEMYPTLPYQTSRPEITDGYFHFRNSFRGLPFINCYHAPNEELKGYIIDQLKMQQKRGFVREDWE